MKSTALKILHFSSAKTWRGGEQQIAYLYEELSKLGQEQWIACPSGSDLEKYCIHNQIPFLSYKKAFSFNPIPAFKVARFCKENQIDLLHLHDSHAHTFGVLSATLFGNKVPMILSRRVIVPIAKNSLSTWKYNHDCIRTIICVSKAIQELVVEEVKDKSKPCVVHSGIDLSKFKNKSSGILRKQYQISSSTPLIGKVAAIGHLKDYFTFVKTVKILVEAGVKVQFMIIGGDGGAELEIRSFVKELGLEQKIIFTGFRSDVPTILPELDVFLFTSKSEGLGTSILDAMACKVPVVATKAGGIPEIVEHGKTGFLSEIGDAESLAKQISEILNRPILRKQIIENANQKVLDFSKEEMAKNTLSIYNRMLLV